jgi:hypothetical protein
MILATVVITMKIIYALGVPMIDSALEPTDRVTRMPLEAGSVRICGAKRSLSKTTRYREYKATNHAEVAVNLNGKSIC